MSRIYLPVPDGTIAKYELADVPFGTSVIGQLRTEVRSYLPRSHPGPSRHRDQFDTGTKSTPGPIRHEKSRWSFQRLFQIQRLVEQCDRINFRSTPGQLFFFDRFATVKLILPFLKLVPFASHSHRGLLGPCCRNLTTKVTFGRSEDLGNFFRS